MTENIHDFVFDFEKEVHRMRGTLGTKADNILFVETDITPDDKGVPHVDAGRTIGPPELERENGPDVRAYVAHYYRHFPGDTSQAFTLRENGDGDIMGHILAVRKKEIGSRTFGAEYESLMRLWIFYHETGHALIPDGPDVDKNHAYKECAADAYAALRLLQRFGPEARDIISMISWDRALSALYGDTGHFTSTALDTILADSEQEDFSALDANETIKRAQSYAKQWTPKASAMAQVHKLFAETKDLPYSQMLRTCLASPSALCFYIGAKFFQPILQPEGVVFNGVPLQAPDTLRSELAGAIEKRGAETRLSDIFDKRSLRKEARMHPLGKLLKVSRRENRKPFTANSPVFS